MHAEQLSWELALWMLPLRRLMIISICREPGLHDTQLIDGVKHVKHPTSPSVFLFLAGYSRQVGRGLTQRMLDLMEACALSQPPRDGPKVILHVPKMT
jgi:hypothetical protein